MSEVDVEKVKSQLQQEFLELMAIDSPSWGEAEMAVVIRKSWRLWGFR